MAEIDVAGQSENNIEIDVAGQSENNIEIDSDIYFMHIQEKDLYNIYAYFTLSWSPRT
jgi:hypothetical protein